MIGIINYGSGNITAIVNVLKRQGIAHLVVNSVDGIRLADRFILPGVGHFEKAVDKMRRKDFFLALSDAIHNQKKFVLGICVGMQVFADYSEEGGAQGLMWVPGKVSKFSSSAANRTPHMGWNSISVANDDHGLFDGVDFDKGFYFLHSYRYVPQKATCSIATSYYGEEFCCALTNGENIFGVQFHPEKSHQNGEILFRNFTEIG
jgi:glutamine amidotransferase